MLDARNDSARQRSPPPRESIDIGLMQVRQWLDESQFRQIEQVSDQQAEFNFRIQVSDQVIHIIKNRQHGPLVLTGQVILEENIQSSLDNLSSFSRRELKARVRGQLTDGSGLYYFLDENANCVGFKEMDRIRIERFIYPDGASQHALMTGIFEVSKQLIHLNDLLTMLIDRFTIESDE